MPTQHTQQPGNSFIDNNIGIDDLSASFRTIYKNMFETNPAGPKDFSAMTKEIELKTKVSWLRFKKQNTKKKPNDFICLRWLKKGGGGGEKLFFPKIWKKKKISLTLLQTFLLHDLLISHSLLSLEWVEIIFMTARIV